MDHVPARSRRRPAARARQVVGAGSLAGFAALAGVIGASAGGDSTVKAITSTRETPATTDPLPTHRRSDRPAALPSARPPTGAPAHASSHSS